jgi:hypothetical protein
VGFGMSVYIKQLLSIIVTDKLVFKRLIILC